MGKHIEAWNALTRLLFIVIFAISIGIFYLMRTGQGYTDFIINVVFAVLAAAFLIVYYASCARPTARIAAALSRVTENILSSKETPKELWTRYGQNPTLFENRRLDERYTAYLREVRRMQKQNSLTADCRIDDYIDEELIYSTVNKPFCDQLGGILTGLGILFTFIGLVYGLRNFDTASVEMMQTSTQALMAGIKIAFLTSIFGLIYSLLFGITYKKLLKDALETLYDFQDTFEESVRPSNEHGAENAMLRLQMEQNTALQTFGSNVGTQVSAALVNLLQPTLDTLQSTITQYVSVAMEDQRAGLEKVVRYFLDGMNTSMGNIFVQLKNRTEELARWEQSMIDSISLFAGGLGDTTRNLSEAQEQALRITGTMAGYSDALQKVTASQQSVIDGLRTLMSDYQTAHRQEAEYIHALSAATDAAAANTSDSRRLAEAMTAISAGIQQMSSESAHEVASAGREISRAAESIRSISQTVTADMTAASAQLKAAVGGLDNSLTLRLTDSITVLDDGIDRLTRSLSGVTAASDSITRAMEAAPRAVTGSDADFRSTSKAIDAELKLLLRAVSETQRNLNHFNSEMGRHSSLS